MKNLVAYGRCNIGHGMDSLYPLNPTGRWMLKTDTTVTDTLYVEHKWLIFKSWVAETDIVFRDEPYEKTFSCSNSGKGRS